MSDEGAKPTEKECEDYLKACGWVRQFVGNRWVNGGAAYYLRDAVKIQMKADETRMAFLAKYLKTNLF